MKTIVKYSSILAAGVVLSASCASEKTLPGIGEDRYIEVVTASDKWTYLSLPSGETVGTSPFGSVADDEAWRQRTDWDIALCGKYLRTNSGTSGNGMGGLMKVEGRSYEAITGSVADGQFEVDTLSRR